MMILAVMQKLLEHSSVGGVISNNQILDAFRKKNPTSKRNLRTLAAKGEMCAKTINLLGTRNKV